MRNKVLCLGLVVLYAVAQTQIDRFVAAQDSEMERIASVRSSPANRCTVNGVASALASNQDFWGKWSLSYEDATRSYVFEVRGYPGRSDKWVRRAATPNEAACSAFTEILEIGENDFAHATHDWRKP